MQVVGAWEAGYFGKGVSVAVVDSNMQVFVLSFLYFENNFSFSKDKTDIFPSPITN